MRSILDMAAVAVVVAALGGRYTLLPLASSRGDCGGGPGCCGGCGGGAPRRVVLTATRDGSLESLDQINAVSRDENDDVVSVL